MAIYTVLTKFEPITFMAINALVAKLAMQVIKSINTKDIILESVAVITIFAKISVHYQIAVFASAGVVDIIGINACTLGI
jgi:hypothetical protein